MYTRQQKDKVQAFLEVVGLEIADENLNIYCQALTHSSYTYESKMSPLKNYERLEFLGDAVLKLVVSQYLFERFPKYREGELTKIRAVIVSDNVLSQFAKELEVGKYMIFGPSEAKTGGANKVSNLACAFEAFLGACFLDGQMPFVDRFVEQLIHEDVTKVDLSKTKDNYKAVLQEFTQAEGIGLPDYRTFKEDGPPHNRTFHIEVSVNNEVVGRGTGKSKKEAQQMAAKMALECLNELGENEQ